MNTSIENNIIAVKTKGAETTGWTFPIEKIKIGCVVPNLVLNIWAHTDAEVNVFCERIHQILQRLVGVKKLTLRALVKKSAIPEAILRNMSTLVLASYRGSSFATSEAFVGLETMCKFVLDDTDPLKVYLPANGNLVTFENRSFVYSVPNEKITELFALNKGLRHTTFWNWQNDDFARLLMSKDHTTDVRLKAQHRIRVSYREVRIDMKKYASVAKITPEMFDKANIQKIWISADEDDITNHLDNMWPILTEMSNLEEITLHYLRSQHGALADVILSRMGDMKMRLFKNMTRLEITKDMNANDSEEMKEKEDLTRERFFSKLPIGMNVALLLYNKFTQYNSMMVLGGMNTEMNKDKNVADQGDANASGVFEIPTITNVLENSEDIDDSPI